LIQDVSGGDVVKTGGDTTGSAIFWGAGRMAPAIRGLNNRT
jgi:hypothetical protein